MNGAAARINIILMAVLLDSLFRRGVLAKMVDECYNTRIFLLGGYCLGPDTPEAFQKAESYILAHLGDTR